MRCPECTESETLLPGTVPCPACGGLDEHCPRCDGEGCVACPACNGRTWLPFGPDPGGPGREGRD